MKANDIIIYSDMDGTCLADQGVGGYMPSENLEAISRFCSAGGLFSVASGRTPNDVLRYFPDGVINAPVVCANGGVVYDPQKKVILRMEFLPKDYKRECLEYCREHPEIAVSAADATKNYRVRTGDGRYPPSSKNCGVVSEEEFEAGDFIKMAFRIPDWADFNEVQSDILRFQSAHGVCIAGSGERYLDVTAKAATKGFGIRYVLQHLGIHRILVCIGDNFNDSSMLELSDIAACPVNAEPEMRAMCRIVTCSNNSGAVADLIRQLMNTAIR